MEATERLAEALARSLDELETKLAAAMVWFDANGAAGLCSGEADFLRSCLRDPRALSRGEHECACAYLPLGRGGSLTAGR
ncbi:hypothetical protein JMJ56_20770 [Belnapia sp. T18]|uniref:Uncharacterized protein n=1 Tax=Belnapia arida TaxID=2804533 RepID=A0ABS1U8H3_9PROT|nr:hypothetical protein [Belnapia arida]MBL6080455.1 hypothetical protein [Belnapia arida]